jgi:hypothetical protein
MLLNSKFVFILIHSDCYVFVSFYLDFVYSIDFELNMRIMSIYVGYGNKVNGECILLRREKIFNFQIKFICVLIAIFFNYQANCG